MPTLDDDDDDDVENDDFTNKTRRTQGHGGAMSHIWSRPWDPTSFYDLKWEPEMARNQGGLGIAVFVEDEPGRPNHHKPRNAKHH